MKSWINERLNRDNFWNLIFGFGMILGISLSALLTEYIYASSGLFWVTILLVPYLVKRNSQITFSADKVFLNHEGESLKGRHPENLFFLIVLTIAIPTLAGLIMNFFNL